MKCEGGDRFIYRPECPSPEELQHYGRHVRCELARVSTADTYVSNYFKHEVYSEIEKQEIAERTMSCLNGEIRMENVFVNTDDNGGPDAVSPEDYRGASLDALQSEKPSAIFGRRLFACQGFRQLSETTRMSLLHAMNQVDIEHRFEKI